LASRPFNNGLPFEQWMSGVRCQESRPLPHDLSHKAKKLARAKAFEQLNFSLWLVVEVTASPGPRLTRGRLLRNDHDTPQLALHLVFDPIFFSSGEALLGWTVSSMASLAFFF
jgi:hypothetical protein